MVNSLHYFCFVSLSWLAIDSNQNVLESLVEVHLVSFGDTLRFLAGFVASTAFDQKSAS